MGNCSSLFKSEEEHSESSNNPSTSVNNSDMSIAPVVLAAKVKHTASVIFLHGLGDTGFSWCEAFRDIQLPHVKYIFPTAKTQSVTLNNGMEMHSWFDIRGLSPNSQEDESGIDDSARYVESLIAEEIKQGIPAERIILGGFSQGGALALFTGITSSHTCGGIVVLSSWLLLHKKIASLTNANSRGIKVLHCHGSLDPLIPLQWAQLSFQHVQQLGFSNYVFKTYPGLMHASNAQEMEDVAQFISSVLPAV